MKTIKLLALFVVAFFTAHSANASVVTIDPAAGLNFDFSWYNGIGIADDSFSITVGGPSTLNVTLRDDYVPGDEFALKLDGNVVSWNSVSNIGGYFNGFANNVFLSAGTHQFDIFLTALAPGYTSGGAHATFSAAVSAVPEPESYAMMLAGLGLLGFLSRRKSVKNATV